MARVRRTVMTTLVAVFAALLGLVFLFLYAIVGAVFGALAGWFVGHTPLIGELVLKGFHELNMNVRDLTAVGAVLGFAAGFFKREHDSN